MEPNPPHQKANTVQFQKLPPNITIAIFQKMEILSFMSIRRSCSEMEKFVRERSKEIAERRFPEYEVNAVVSDKHSYAKVNFYIKSMNYGKVEIGLPNQQLAGIKLDKLHIHVENLLLSASGIQNSLSRFTILRTRVLCFNDLPTLLALKLISLSIPRETVEFNFNKKIAPDFLQLFGSPALEKTEKVMVHSEVWAHDVGAPFLFSTMTLFRHFSLFLIPKKTVIMTLTGFWLATGYGKIESLRLTCFQGSICRDRTAKLPPFHTLYEADSTVKRARQLTTKSVRVFLSAGKCMVVTEQEDPSSLPSYTEHIYWMFFVDLNVPHKLPSWLFDDSTEAREIRSSFPEAYSWSDFCSNWGDTVSFVSRNKRIYAYKR